MIILDDIEFASLSPTVWYATANLAADRLSDNYNYSTLANKQYKRQAQRVGVRLLLQKLLAHLNITDTLKESAFPYRLTDNRYFVCFSHSAHALAVAVSFERAIGIDVEVGTIKWQVAKRYFHQDEIATLHTLSICQRALVSKRLWQIKESFIKIDQSKLYQGLGVSYHSIINELVAIEDFKDPSTFGLEFKINNYTIFTSVHHQLVIVY